MNRGQEQLVIRGTGWFESDEAGISNIKQVPVKTVDGTVVTCFRYCAKVEMGSEIRQAVLSPLTRKTEDGKVENLGEVVSGIVLKRMGSNTKATIGWYQCKNSIN